MLGRRLLFVALALEAGCGGAASQSAPPVAVGWTASSANEVLGSVDGMPIARADLGPEARGRLLEQENEARQRELHLLWVGVEDAVARRLLEREAARRKSSVEAVIAEEVDAKVAPPSEAEVRGLYDANADSIGIPFEQAKSYIAQELTEQAREEARRALVERLRQGSDVRYSLSVPALPRFPVEPGHGPSRGDAGAKVTLIEFSDYQCPYCAQARRVIDELASRYPKDVRVVHRDFPLSQHPQAMPAAKAAFCANEQDKFWPYHEKLFENPTALRAEDLARYARELALDVSKFEQCVASERPEQAVREHMEAGKRFGVQGTPAIYMNGIKLIGLLPLPIMQALVESELRQAAR